jgi:hypothetical protein
MYVVLKLKFASQDIGHLPQTLFDLPTRLHFDGPYFCWD